MLPFRNNDFALRSPCALICRQNVLEMVHREISPDGTYSAYYPFGDMRDVPYMTHFHDKLYVHQDGNRRNLLQPLATTNLRNTYKEDELLDLHLIWFAVAVDGQLLE